MIISIEDLYSRIYEEDIEEITRTTSDEENALVTTAIATAIGEVKMYLSRYDRLQLFGSNDVEPTVNDPLLKSMCVDVAAFHLVLLGNKNIDFKKTKEQYEATVEILKNIQKGNAQPEGWPYKDTSGQTAPQGSAIAASYNKKRKNNF